MTEDVITALKNDATMVSLVGGRIYPDYAGKDPTAPYMVYRVQADAGRTKGNAVSERILGFSIFAATALAAETIERRLKVLLDKDAAVSVPSVEYDIKSSWHSGGTSMYEQETKLYHRAALYTLLYVKK